MQTLIEGPTAAQHLASVMSGRGSVRIASKTRAVLARIPEYQLAELDAIGKLLGKSRSATVTHLLDVAFEELRRVASADVRERLDVEHAAAMEALQSEEE